LGFVKVHKPVTHITNQLQKIRVATMWLKLSLDDPPRNNMACNPINIKS
jgi:hypothetical protein